MGTGKVTAHARKSRVDLDDARAQRILVVLGAFGQRTSAALARNLGDLDLTGNVPVLVVCELALGGPCRPSHLKDVTGLTSGGVSKHLDRLEALGLVERSFGRVEGDRRAIIVALTPKGDAVAGRMAKAVREQAEDVRATLGVVSALLVD